LAGPPHRQRRQANLRLLLLASAGAQVDVLQIANSVAMHARIDPQ
jgi:hypothetical protein